MTDTSTTVGYDAVQVLRTMRNSLSIATRFDLLLWLQGEFQEAIPHDVLITFTGSIGGDLLHYDIVPTVPAMHWASMQQFDISEFRAGIHQRWLTSGRRVTSGSITDACVCTDIASNANKYLGSMHHLLFHAISDTRLQTDHLYILLRREKNFSDQERKLFEVMLPHIDAAVSKIDAPPLEESHEATTPDLRNALMRAGLTTREVEILEWVRNGKTNIEIGMILDISAFTVKNHLQRIYKKLNVANRAQAVGKFEEIASSSLAQSAM